MYSEKFAVCIKSAGKVLREFNKDSVYIPFSSEYTILIKNLNTMKALVKVYIDGNDVTEGIHLVVNPKEDYELTRSIRNGNLNQGNAFKFIERTTGIEQHRGIKIEDGLIRIEYQFEKAAPEVETIVHHEYHYWYDYHPYTPQYCHNDSNSTGNAAYGLTLATAQFSAEPVGTSEVNNLRNVECSVKTKGTAVNEIGITAPGSINDQKFSITETFAVEETMHSMVIRLLGTNEKGKVVKKAVTVQMKPRCTMCGTVNKATAKFCGECSTALVIV
jgi:hypothetical protein